MTASTLAPSLTPETVQHRAPAFLLLPPGQAIFQRCLQRTCLVCAGCGRRLGRTAQGGGRRGCREGVRVQPADDAAGARDDPRRLRGRRRHRALAGGGGRDRGLRGHGPQPRHHPIHPRRKVQPGLQALGVHTQRVYRPPSSSAADVCGRPGIGCAGVQPGPRRLTLIRIGVVSLAVSVVRPGPQSLILGQMGTVGPTEGSRLDAEPAAARTGHRCMVPPEELRDAIERRNTLGDAA